MGTIIAEDNSKRKAIYWRDRRVCFLDGKPQQEIMGLGEAITGLEGLGWARARVYGPLATIQARSRRAVIKKSVLAVDSTPDYPIKPAVTPHNSTPAPLHPLTCITTPRALSLQSNQIKSSSNTVRTTPAAWCLLVMYEVELVPGCRLQLLGDEFVRDSGGAAAVVAATHREGRYRLRLDNGTEKLLRLDSERFRMLRYAKNSVKIIWVPVGVRPAAAR